MKYKKLIYMQSMNMKVYLDMVRVLTRSLRSQSITCNKYIK